MRGILFGTILLTAMTPAFAIPSPSPSISDPYGAGSIARGRTAAVEQRLAVAYARGDRSTELLLNLAAIRLNARDGQGAQALYREVLAQPNADMATLSGNAWSHDIARRAMSTSFAGN